MVATRSMWLIQMRYTELLTLNKQTTSYLFNETGLFGNKKELHVV